MPFRFLFRRRPPAGAGALAKSLREMFPRCPVGGQAVSGHRYVEIASLPLTRDGRERIEKFLTAAEEEDWTRLRELHCWDGRKDCLVVYGIDGGHDQAAQLIVRSPFELWDENHLVEQRLVAAAPLRDLPGLEWKAMRSGGGRRPGRRWNMLQHVGA